MNESFGRDASSILCYSTIPALTNTQASNQIIINNKNKNKNKNNKQSRNIYYNDASIVANPATRC